MEDARDKSSLRPDAARTERRGCGCAARVVLALGTAMNFALGVALVAYGAKAAGADVENAIRLATGGVLELDALPKFRDDDAELRWDDVAGGTANVAPNAFNVMVGLGAALIVSAIVGAVGVCAPKACCIRGTLFAGYVLQLAMSVVLAWGAALCFVWPTHAQRQMDAIIDTVYDPAAAAFAVQGEPARDREGAKEYLAEHVKNAGVFFVVATVVALLNMWAIAELIGHAFTARALVISTSVATLLSSLALGGVAVATAVQGTYGDWAAYVLAVLALFTLLVSTLGIAGAARQDPLYLGLHAFSLLMLTLLVGCVGAVCFSLPNETLALVEEHILGEDMTGTTPEARLDELEQSARANLDGLGVIAVASSVLLAWNAFASVLAFREAQLAQGARRAAAAAASVEV